MKTIPFEGKLSEEQEKNIKEWVAALRSGKYNQGRWQLFSVDNNLYCSLGVACEISKIPKSGMGFEMTDPVWFKDRYGLSREQMAALIYLNDELEFTFDKIADVIEACFIERKEIEL